MTNRVWFGGAAAAALAALLASASAHAATVTNDDAEERTVEVYIGDAATMVPIAPGQTVEVCPEGCLLVLEGEEFDAPDGDEVFRISGGRLAFDG